MKYLIGILCLLLVCICGLVCFNLTVDIDNFIYNLIIGFESDFMTSFMYFITDFGGILLIGIFSVLSLILFKDKVVNIIVLVVDIVILNNLLKLLFFRERPVGIEFYNELGYSFPSGHTMISTAFYGYMCYLICKKIDKKYHSFMYIGLSIILILIGCSRIYLGVHYFSDVVAAYLFSTLYLILFIFLTEKKGLLSPK